MSGCKYITISYNILSDKRLNSTDKLVYGIMNRHAECMTVVAL